MTDDDAGTSLAALGWREWIALPSFGIERIKAKLDTGARSSALHAFRVRPFDGPDGAPMVRFWLHPLQRDEETVAVCEAPVHDRRWVSDSGGHRERRYVILAPVAVGGTTFEAEMTLTNRDSMRFRMLLGRTALAERFVVDAGRSYVLGRPRRRRRRPRVQD